MLIHAVRKGDAPLVESLLDQDPRARMETRDSLNSTLLMNAALHLADTAVMEVLLREEAVAQVQARSLGGTTALILAIEAGHAESVQVLLRHCPEAQVMAVDTSQKTPLMFAAEIGHDKCISVLLGAGSVEWQLMARNERGWTALMIAAENGHAHCLQTLLDAGHQKEQLLAKDEHGCTALIITNEPRCLQTLLAAGHEKEQLLAKGDGGKTALMIAAATADARCLRTLLAAGHQKEQLLDRSDGSYCNWTALMLAVSASPDFDNIECAKLLLDAGFQEEQLLKATDEDGWNALMVAANHDASDAIRFFLAAGFKEDQLKAQGHWSAIDDALGGVTALMIASENGHAESIKALLDHDVALQKLDEAFRLLIETLGGETLRGEYPSSGQVDCIKRMFSLGASLPTDDAASMKFLEPFLRDCVKLAHIPDMIHAAVAQGVTQLRVNKRPWPFSPGGSA